MAGLSVAVKISFGLSPVETNVNVGYGRSAQVAEAVGFVVERSAGSGAAARGRRTIVASGFPAGLDQLRLRQILSRLAVAVASSASAWAASMPRQENWRSWCLSLRCPFTGSTVTPRWDDPTTVDTVNRPGFVGGCVVYATSRSGVSVLACR